MCEETIGYLCDNHHREVQPHPIKEDAAGVTNHNTTPPHQHGCDRCREPQHKAQGEVQEAH
jgi:hypothetical protein